MPRSKKKIYIAFMLLGGAALVVDRCVLTPSVTMPATVAAAVPPPPAASALPAKTLSTLELPFPRAIPVWDPQSPIRDLFAPFSDEDATDKRRKRSPRGADAGHGTCAGLLSQHHLEAVLVQESLKIAILDGAWVRIGESVDGCVLTEIVGHKVRFRCRDGDTLLTLSSRN
ncbi:MAG: hypothetical protein AAB363_04920 [Planctomycetota bacterium]